MSKAGEVAGFKTKRHHHHCEGCTGIRAPQFDQLSRRGWIDPAQLYESPFVDVHPHGIAGVFSVSEVKEMLSILTTIKHNAEAARA